MARTPSRSSTSAFPTWAATTTAPACTSGSARRSAPASCTCARIASRRCGRMFGDMGVPDDDIRKLNHTGTHPVHTDLAIHDAIAFHESIGIAAQGSAAALAAAVLDRPRCAAAGTSCCSHPSDPARTGAIANVGVAGIDAGRPGHDAARQVPHLDGGDRHAPACRACASAAAVHDARGAGHAGAGDHRTGAIARSRRVRHRGDVRRRGITPVAGPLYQRAGRRAP